MKNAIKTEDAVPYKYPKLCYSLHRPYLNSERLKTIPNDPLIRYINGAYYIVFYKIDQHFNIVGYLYYQRNIANEIDRFFKRDIVNKIEKGIVNEIERIEKINR
jgi:hypothetical protein